MPLGNRNNSTETTTVVIGTIQPPSIGALNFTATKLVQGNAVHEQVLTSAKAKAQANEIAPFEGKIVVDIEINGQPFTVRYRDTAEQPAVQLEIS